MTLAVKFGIYTGIISVIWKYTEYKIGVTHDSFGGLAGFFPYFLLFIGIATTIYFQRRSEEFGIGNISFKDGARTGVIISLITGLFFAGYTMLHGLVLNPAYLQEYVGFVREALEEQHKSQAIIEQEIADIQNSGSIGKLMFASFTTTLVIGMVGSFIIAGLFKKESHQPH